MANSTPNIPMQQNNISEINDLVSLFKSMPTITQGSNTKTVGPSSTTVKSDISSEGINAILQSILSGNSGIQGLSQLAQGQKSAGLYNSTVNQQLSNDLLTKASAEVAKQSAGTTTTTSGNTITDNNNQSVAKAPPLTGNTLATAALGLGANALAKKGYKSIEDLLSGGSGADLAASANAADASMTGSAFTGGNITSGTQSALSAASPGLESSIASASVDPLVSASLGTGEAAGLGEAASVTGDYLTAGEVGVGTAAGAGVAGATISAETAAALGTGELGFIGAGIPIAAEAGGGIEGALVAAALWVICTELYRQGKMPMKYYIPGAKVFYNYPDIGKPGYYIWAIPCVRHLRKYPNSLLSKVLCKVFNARAQMLAHRVGVTGVTNNFLGMATEAILFPMCYTLGVILHVTRTSSRFDPKSLYSRSK